MHRHRRPLLSKETRCFVLRAARRLRPAAPFAANAASRSQRRNSCETLFFFLLIDGDKVRNTPLFGTCAPEGSYRQRGDAIALDLPKMGGNSQIVLRDGEVIEDGRTITLDNLNDPAK
nr:hypothetical protein [Massilia brevitalea]